MTTSTRVRSLVVSFSDLDAVQIETAGGAWIAVGLNAEQESALARSGFDAAVTEQLMRTARDAVVVHVSRHDGAVVALDAWRGLLAPGDLFYVEGDDGSIVVTDHFRNAVRCVPLKDRAPSDDALLEHYLGGWVYDRATYSAGVSRLAVGDRLHIDLMKGRSEVSIFDRFTPSSEAGARDTAIDRVEKVLHDELTPYRDDPSACAGFSGGVDSTLLATFLGEDTPIAAVTTDSPEFDAETEYARAAARLLGRELTEVNTAERDYVSLLEDTVDRLGMPPHHYVIPMLSVLYSRPETTYVLGEGADSVFGSGRGLERIAGAAANPTGLAALRMLRRAPGPIGSRSAQVHSYADRFARHPRSAASASARSLLGGDTALVEAFVEEAEVERIVALHQQSVRDRVELETPESSRFRHHIEFKQWRHTLADLASVDRHLAQSYRKRVVLPFALSAAVNEIRRVPADRRYIRGMSGKWVLKGILGRRLPDYSVNQRKLATGLPFERYYTDGPLTRIWDRYEVPDFIDPSIRDEVVSTPSETTWHAITHAVWLDRIGRNPNVDPIPSSTKYEAPLSS